MPSPRRCLSVPPRATPVVVVVAACALSACFDLPPLDVPDGAIALTALRDDGTPAIAAQARVPGRAVAAVDVVNARALLTGLLPGPQVVFVREDIDDDGVAERGAIATTRLAVADFGTGAFSASVRRVSTSLLGPITLAPTGSAHGSVAFDASTERARVVVWRTVDVPAVDATGGATSERIDSVVEDSAGVDAAGAWRIDGLVAGDVHLAAFVWARDPAEDDGSDVDVQRQRRVVAAGTPLRLLRSDASLVPGSDVEVALAPLAVDVTTPTAIEVVLAGDVDELERATGSVFAEAPGTTLPRGASDFDGFADAGLRLGLLANVGLVQLHVDAGASLGGSGGPFVVVPGATPGPLSVGVARACDVDGAFDCDGDGHPALVDAAGDLSAMRACATTCADAWGVSDATCTPPGSSTAFDCDDDADGQPDATEPLACITPDAGTDRDGDGSCDAIDPFPRCSSDDPQDCALVDRDPAARAAVRPEYR